MEFDRNRTSTGMKIVIIIFAIVLVVSLMLPSLTALFSHTSQEQAETPVASEQVAPSTPADIDAYYEPSVQALKKRLESDPQNVALNHDLGNSYFDWAMHRSYLSQGDPAQEARLKEIFGMAVVQYDKVLAVSPAHSVKVDRTIALFYTGAEDQARADLEEFVHGEGAQFAPAWANLAGFYEKVDKDKAKEDYNKALELIGDDPSHARLKTFIESRLALMENASQAALPQN